MRKLMYKNSEIGGGGSGNFNITELTQAEYNALTTAQKSDTSMLWIITDAVGSNLGEYIGSVKMCLQNSIPDGWLSCENGQVVLRSAYPELWAWVQENAPLVSEVQWQAKAALQKSVGYYSDGDGSTTFRLPRLVGFVEGTTAANAGQFTEAGLPNIEGGVTTSYAAYDAFAVMSQSYGTGAIELKNTKSGTGVVYGDSSNPTVDMLFDASQSNSIYGNSDTVQPESVGMVWCVRAFGAAVNQGTVDITALAQSLNLKASIALNNLSQAGEDHFLERDFTIIYPNGGTEANPANITYGSSYVMSNPFPGYAVGCVVEVLYNGIWGNINFVWDSGGLGAKASQVSTGNIVVQTGSNTTLLYSSTEQGNPFRSNINLSSVPARVKVWKIGKISI